MNIINRYSLLLAIVPFVLIYIGAWLLDALPKGSVIGAFLDILAEKDLEIYMRKNGFNKTSVRSFQVFRVIVGLVVAGFLASMQGEIIKKILWAFATLIVVYKAFYVYLLMLDAGRISRLNKQLPYVIKSIAYLVYSFPVTNAIQRAIEISPPEFKYDLEQLTLDIDNDPTNFTPYQKFIDRYDGKLKNLDNYLKILYRMSMSATKEEAKLLSSLNATISDELSYVRQEKNNAINSRVSYLGLIPIMFLVAMLMYALIVITGAI